MSESDVTVRALVAGHGDFAAGIVSAQRGQSRVGAATGTSGSVGAEGFGPGNGE